MWQRPVRGSLASEVTALSLQEKVAVLINLFLWAVSVTNQKALLDAPEYTWLPFVVLWPDNRPDSV